MSQSIHGFSPINLSAPLATGSHTMTLIKKTILAGLCAFAAVGATTNAHANPIAGTFDLSVWSADTNTSAQQNGTETNPLASGSAVYRGTYTGAINFSQQSGVNNIATFLGTAGGSLSAGATTGAGLNTTLSNGGFTHASLFDFTFTTTSPAIYTVSHDDGFSIWNATNSSEIISGAEGPTISVDTTFTLAAGTYNLWYAEANGLPADLTMNVPEPASMALLGLGMIGTGVAARRRRSTAA